MDSSLLKDFRSFQAHARPIFLFGNNRAGTTLLHTLSGLHEDTFKLRKNTYFMEQFWKYRRLLSRKALLRLYRGGILWPELPAPEREAVFWECFYVFKELLPAMKPAELFTCFAFTDYMLRRDKQELPSFWVEKTNNHVFHYRRLKDWFPEARFVCIVRSPQANAASAYKVAASRNGGRELPLVQSAAIAWVMYNSRIRSLVNDYGDDTYLVRYEDLVSAPLDEVARLHEFLDLCPMPEERLRDKLETLGNFKPSNIGVERNGSIDTVSVAYWRGVLSKEQVEIIQRITWPLAEFFGYGQEETGVTANALGKISAEDWRSYGRRRLWQVMEQSGAWRLWRMAAHWK